jgi:2-polyprenyl-6-methoxyphenol hydroxylase-like FAD-dependent oxidoreductase
MTVINEARRTSACALLMQSPYSADGFVVGSAEVVLLLIATLSGRLYFDAMTETTFDCEVLVVGAGPVGLATALSLLVQGVDVRIVDDMPARHATARASAIHARTLELLAPFGVADRIAAYAQPIRRVLFLDDQGREVFRRELRALDSQYPAQQNLQQWHAEWIIAEQLLARGVNVMASTRCTGLAQDNDGVVAELETEAGTTTLRCRYLIGADGARSTVRKACGTSMIGRDYPERWIGGELDIEHTDVMTHVTALFGAERFAFSLPLDGGIMFFATLRDDEYPDARPGRADPDHVMALYHATFGAYPHLASRVRGVAWTGHFEMHSCCVPDFRIGRVFLAGDAAHLVSAAGGYGMNGGIQDGINLAWRLAAHLRLNADVSILDGYNVDRQEMFEQTNAKSDSMHQLMVGRDAAALGKPELRTPEFMAAADRAVGEVDVGYSRDRMWRDEAKTGVFRAGMRVPPTADFASGEGASRTWASLYDGFNWTVVIAVPDRTTLRTADIRQFDLAALVWLNGRVRLVSAVGDAFAWNAPRPTLYVIRPDGYIAFRCDADPGSLPDVKRLTAWLVNSFASSLADHAAP